MFVVFSVIPLLEGRSTRNIICIVHIIYIVSTLSEGAKQHLLIKRLYRNVPKNFVNIERKWNSNTGTMERVGASNVHFANKYSRHFVTCSYP